MMSANLQEILPQEGTSIPAVSPHSGGGTNLQLHEDVPDDNYDESLEQSQFLDDIQKEMVALQETTVDDDRSKSFSPHTPPLSPEENGAENNKHSICDTAMGDESSDSEIIFTSCSPPLPPKNTNQLENNNMNRVINNTGNQEKSTGRKRRPRSRLQGNQGKSLLAIVPINYPVSHINDSLVLPIQSYLWDKLEATPDPIPIINVGSISSGALKVTCDDRSSKWLTSLNGVTINGVKLKVLHSRDLKLINHIQMAWWTKTTKSDVARILSLLQRIHPNLSVGNWKIKNTTVQLKTTLRIIVMDRISADYIKSNKYCLYSGIGMSYFKYLGEVKSVT